MKVGQKLYGGHHTGHKFSGHKFHGNKFHSGSKSGLLVVNQSSDGNIYNSSNSQDVMKESTKLIIHHNINKKKQSYLQIEKKVRKSF